MVAEAMKHARSLDLVDLLVNTGGLVGFPSPESSAATARQPMGRERRCGIESGDRGSPRAHRSAKNRRVDGPEPRRHGRRLHDRSRGHHLAGRAQRIGRNHTIGPATAEHAAMNAGPFSEWLRAMREALAGNAGMDVACGDCRGCCTSSYFIKVRAHETRALEHIGEDSLRPVPGSQQRQPCSWDSTSRAHCFMFANGGCSIYQHRPETCRTYDCRVFTAAGMNAGPDKTEINERVASWRFEYPERARPRRTSRRHRGREFPPPARRSAFPAGAYRRGPARSPCSR